MKILTCNSNRPLAEAISAYLGLPLMKASVRRFSDMEVFVEIHENVRGEDVFVIQSTSYPANDNLMELLVALDALRRSSARRVTAVIPYYGYARQDRKSSPRSPISAKLVANLITTAGAHRVLTLDLHAGQIQGFFDIPTDNLYAEPVLVKDIQERHAGQDLVMVSPDVGGVFRTRQIARRLDADLAIVDKRRERAGVSEVMNIIGDVEGRRCILIDDIVDSAGTLCNAAEALMDKGAEGVYAYVTHGVLSGGAVARVVAAPIKELVLTDSIVAKEAVLISLEPRALARIVAKPGFFATLIDISVDGTTHRTLPRDVQYHPISDAPLHVDFMRVGAGAQVNVMVPVEFINHERSIGLRRGGILNIVRHGIEMICSVDNIPERIVVDLDGLDIGDSVHIGAIEMPPAARPAIHERDFTIASIAASSAVKEEAQAAA